MTIPDGDDVLELGRERKRPARWRPAAATVLGTAALLAGLAIGYAAGARHTGKPAASPPPSAVTAPAAQFAAGGFPLSQSGPECSAQNGHRLQVGLQITNLSSASVRLRRVAVVLPLRGLRVITRTWGPCGELPPDGEAPGGTPPPALGPSASTWFTVTFQVLISCPQPLPVQFTLDYEQQGRPAAIRLPGFPDLSQVPYSGCR